MPSLYAVYNMCSEEDFEVLNRLMIKKTLVNRNFNTLDTHMHVFMKNNGIDHQVSSVTRYTAVQQS